MPHNTIQYQDASDTLTLMLTNAVHRDKPLAIRAHHIKRVAKIVQNRTKDKSLKNACRALRNAQTNGLVVQAIELAEYRYFCQ